MKTKITKEEYDRILATELSSDVAPGTPGHIDDHELIAQKIAYSGSLSVGSFYKTGDDQWFHSYMGETAGISDTGPHTTDETLRGIDNFSSGSEYFLVFPTEESISDPSSVPDQGQIEIRVFNSKSFDNLFTFLHHYVGYSLKDTLSYIAEMFGAVEVLYRQVGELDTKVSTLESDGATLNTTVSQLGEDVTALSTANSTLEGQVSTLESDNASLNTTVSGLETDLGSLSSANDTLSSTVSTLEGNVATLTSDKEALEGQVSSLESSNGTLSSTVSTLESTVGDLASDKEALEGQVSTLESTIADFTSRLEALENPTSPE